MAVLATIHCKLFDGAFLIGNWLIFVVQVWMIPDDLCQKKRLIRRGRQCLEQTMQFSRNEGQLHKSYYCKNFPRMSEAGS